MPRFQLIGYVLTALGVAAFGLLWLSDELSYVTVAAFAGLIGAGVALVLASPNRSSEGLEAPTDDGVVAVTDAQGVLLTGPQGTSITDLLHNRLVDADAAAYRVLSGLEATTRLPAEGLVAMEQSAADDAPVVLHVTNASADLARTNAFEWRLISLSDASVTRKLGYRDALFAWVRCSPDGKVLEANSVAESWGLIAGSTAPEAPAGSNLLRHPTKTGASVMPLPVVEGGEARELIYVEVTDTDLGLGSRDAFLNYLPLPLIIVDRKGRVQKTNASVRSLLRSRLDPGTELQPLLDQRVPKFQKALSAAINTNTPSDTDTLEVELSETKRYLQFSVMPFDGEGDDAALVIFGDATHTKTLEAQFIHGQKMQTVGQLAGGIAHDFNNLLTAITGYCDLLLMRHEVGDTDYADLQQINQNANRAAALVRQLLAFSRKQALNFEIVEISDTLDDLSHLANRLIGDQLTLRIIRDEGLPRVSLDKRQFEQVILNLLVNARDAMPEGGTIELRCRRAKFESPTERDGATVPPGTYVMIQVSDTGVGIAPAQIKKVFEPFFTTKSVGKGTGLGLSTAYGIIKQFKGFIFADSRLGLGTTFTVLLPEETAKPAEPKPEKPILVDMPEIPTEATVLLVEDEAPVRAFAAKALKLKGFNVLEAPSGDAALEMLKDRKTLHPDLVLSDVMMPGRDGPTWVREALDLRPAMQIVFMSGYAEDVFTDERPNVPGAGFLAKPFSLASLIDTVQTKLTQG